MSSSPLPEDVAAASGEDSPPPIKIIPGQINPGLPGLEGLVLPVLGGEEELEEDEPLQDIPVMMPPKEEESEEFLCGADRKENLFDLSRIPLPVRLNAQRKTKLDYIFDGVPKPRGYLPEKQMPAWVEYPFSKKLPTIPAPKEYLYYSRGVLGEVLHRKDIHYTVDDPNNKEMVVSFPYDPLHDRHAKSFYEKPKVQKQLVDYGLVSKTNKAICSVKDFNKYRQYLYKRTFVEDVKEVIHDKDAHDAALRKIINEVKKEVYDTEGKGFVTTQRIKAAKEHGQKQLMDRLRRGVEMQKASEAKQARFAEAKQNIMDERRAINREQERMNKKNVARMERARVDARAALIKDIAAGDKANSDRRAHDKALIKRAYKQFLLEWMDAKWDYQKIMITKQKLVGHTVDRNAQTNAQKRQDRVELIRSHMPQMIEKRKKEEMRIWEIVRKYFNRWRDNVRLRKARRPDAMHKSNWEVEENMDKTLEYLRKESGYEKLDDFIMGIVALKKRIKMELEAEEAAEAAEAAAQAARKGSASSNPDKNSKLNVREEEKPKEAAETKPNSS